MAGCVCVCGVSKLWLRLALFDVLHRMLWDYHWRWVAFRCLLGCLPRSIDDLDCDASLQPNQCTLKDKEYGGKRALFVMRLRMQPDKTRQKRRSTSSTRDWHRDRRLASCCAVVMRRSQVLKSLNWCVCVFRLIVGFCGGILQGRQRRRLEEFLLVQEVDFG